MTTSFKRSFSSWRRKTAQTNRIFIFQTWHVNNEVIEWLVVIMNKEFCAWHFINSRYLVEVIRLLPTNCIKLSKLYPNRTIQPRKRHRSHHNHVKNVISNLIAVLGISHKQWSIPLLKINKKKRSKLEISRFLEEIVKWYVSCLYLLWWYEYNRQTELYSPCCTTQQSIKSVVVSNCTRLISQLINWLTNI